MSKLQGMEKPTMKAIDTYLDTILTPQLHPIHWIRSMQNYKMSIFMMVWSLLIGAL
jgi:hypothetical protein